MQFMWTMKAVQINDLTDVFIFVRTTLNQFESKRKIFALFCLYTLFHMNNWNSNIVVVATTIHHKSIYDPHFYDDMYKYVWYCTCKRSLRLILIYYYQFDSRPCSILRCSAFVSITRVTKWNYWWCWVLFKFLFFLC